MSEMHPDSRSNQPHPANSVVIVGGGLAGLATGLGLAEHGVAVTLVEARKRLGGRASSFQDQQSDEVLDNCQHVLLRSCTNLLDFYQRLGVEKSLHWYRRFYFAYPTADGQPGLDVMQGDDLPAPLHLTRSLLGFGGLSIGDKIAIARGMLAILQVSRRGRGLYRDRSFAHWLEEHRQPRSAIDKFWTLVITSACNETIDRVPASYAIQVFQEGFLYQPNACEMALPAITLEALYQPAQSLLARAGGKILHGVRGQHFIFDDDQQRVSGLRTADGQELIGDAFISAVPPDRLSNLLPESMKRTDERLGHLDELEVSPIIGIHLFFETGDAQCESGKSTQRQTHNLVMDLPHVVLRDSPLQWIFNKGVVEGGQFAGTQHLHGVISAAHDWVDQPPERIVDMALAELRRFFPPIQYAKLLHRRVIKEKRATISVRPEIDALRPGTTGQIGNFYLAGDWTRTHWPATMEGAVRSGYRAAAAAQTQFNSTAEPQSLKPSLQPSPLYRLLSG